MQHPQQRIKEAQSGLIGSLVDRLLITGLHHLQIPGRELIPEELIDSHQGLAQTVLREEVVHLYQGLIQLLLEPLHGNGSCLRLCQLLIHRPALHQTEGIPDLIIEVSTLLTQRIVERNIITCGSGQHQAHTYTIGTILGDQLQRIG